MSGAGGERPPGPEQRDLGPGARWVPGLAASCRHGRCPARRSGSPRGGGASGAPAAGRDARAAHVPAGWSAERVQEYFRWAARVVAGLRGTSSPLEAALRRLFEERGLAL